MFQVLMKKRLVYAMPRVPLHKLKTKRNGSQEGSHSAGSQVHIMVERNRETQVTRRRQARNYTDHDGLLEGESDDGHSIEEQEQNSDSSCDSCPDDESSSSSSSSDSRGGWDFETGGMPVPERVEEQNRAEIIEITADVHEQMDSTELENLEGAVGGEVNKSIDGSSGMQDELSESDSEGGWDFETGGMPLPPR